jgi:hypothetical protein
MLTFQGPTAAMVPARRESDRIASTEERSGEGTRIG